MTISSNDARRRKVDCHMPANVSTGLAPLRSTSRVKIAKAAAMAPDHRAVTPSQRGTRAAVVACS